MSSVYKKPLGKKKSIVIQRERIVSRRKQTSSRISGKFELVLTTESYFHIGAGGSIQRFPRNFISKVQQVSSVCEEFDTLISYVPASARELAEFYKINELFAIPGSTLKGAARSNIELGLRVSRDEVPACYIVADSRFDQNKTIRHKQYYNYTPASKILFRKNCRILKLKPKHDIGRETTCVTCQMFGKMGLRALLSFSPAFLPNDSIEQSIVIKHEHGASIELITPGQSFLSKIAFTNLSHAELGLLIYLGLKYQDKKGFRLGYRKYSNLVEKQSEKKYEMGRIKVEIPSIVIDDQHYTEKDLLSFLADNIKPAMEKKYSRFLFHKSQ